MQSFTTARALTAAAFLFAGCRYYGSTTPPPASQAEASPFASHGEIGTFAGVHTFAGDNSLGGLRDSAVFGARAGWYFGGYFGLEAQAGVIPTEASAAVYDVWLLLAGIHGVYAPLGDRVDSSAVPFLFAGGTLYDVVSSGGTPGSAISSGSLVAPDVGVGVKDTFDSRWGVRADASVVFPSAAGGGWTDELELLVSIYRTYGAPATAAPH